MHKLKTAAGSDKVLNYNSKDIETLSPSVSARTFAMTFFVASVFLGCFGVFVFVYFGEGGIVLGFFLVLRAVSTSCWP